MRSLITFFLRRPLLVNLLTISILGVGILTSLFLKKEVFPKVDFGYIMITTDYLGSSAEDVEKLVTVSLERKLKEVDGIEEMNSMSMENRSMITLQVDPDYNVDKVLDEVTNAVEQVTDLPDKAERPLVKKLDNKDAIIKIALWGAPEEVLREASKKLRDHLELIPDVSRVDLGGYREEEIKVSIDPKKLARHELTISEVVQAINNRNINLSAGTIETSEADIILRTVSEFQGAEDVGEVVIRSNETGQRVKVSDVAQVKRQLVESNVLQRSQGKQAIFLDVIKKERADIITVTDKLKESVKQFFAENQYEGLQHTYVDDFSFYVKRRLSVLVQNGLQGLVLVFICLLFFLNWRTSLVTSLGVPVAVMAAFIFMDGLGLSINLISMFGLILVLGMLVDDSIIVAEQFYQHLEQGKSPYVAAETAAHETVIPVIGTVLTTIVAFGSLFFMGGIMGKFLWPVPAAVIVCLLASLIECFIIMPNHLAEFVKLEKRPEEGRVSFREKWYRPIHNLYSATLRKALHHYWLVFFGFMGLLAATAYTISTMKVELFPGDDIRIMFLNIKGKVGTPLDKTDEAMKKVDQIVLETMKKDELESIRSLVGIQVDEHMQRRGSHYGTSIIYMTESIERGRSTDEILNELAEKIKPAIPNYNVSFAKVSGGPPKGKAVEIELSHPDLDKLKSLSKQVSQELSQLPGVVGAETDFEEGKRQLVVDIDDEEARRLGVTTTQVAMEIRRAYAGDSVTIIRDNEDDVDVVVQLNEQARTDVRSLEDLYILNNQFRRIRLGSVAKIVEGPGAFLIRRFNKKRTISVVSEIDRAVTTPVQVGSLMTPILNKLSQKESGLTFRVGGENKDTKESMARLGKAAVMAIVCIFIILVTMFASLGQSFIIMTAIPFGLVGVVFTFKIAGLPFSFMGLMGVVGLVGVVVNDSIVLVSFINEKLRSQGLSLKEAVYEGARSRLRAVILTTVTTVAGLLPLAHATGGDPFLKPMALSFAYGLLFSTSVTLIFVPCCYMIYFRLMKLFFRVFGRTFKTVGIERPDFAKDLTDMEQEEELDREKSASSSKKKDRPVEQPVAH